MEHNSPNNPIFPDLGPKTVNKLLEEHLSGIYLDRKEVPIDWVDNATGAKKENLPSIWIEFIDITPAQDRQFSDILETEYSKLPDGTYSDTAVIDYPQAYFVTYDVHLFAETVDNIVDLVTKVAKRMPSQGFAFEIESNGGTYSLALQRPNAPLNADVTEDSFYHRVYTYQVETYIFDESTLKTLPNLDDDADGNAKVNVTVEPKDEN